MMQAAEAEIKAALSLSDDANGDVQEAHVQLEEDVPVISIADMRPLKQPDSVALCQRLYLEMFVDITFTLMPSHCQLTLNTSHKWCTLVCSRVLSIDSIHANCNVQFITSNGTFHQWTAVYIVEQAIKYTQNIKNPINY